MLSEVNMELSKRIPARTKTVQFNWAVKDFTECTEQYRKIRTNLGKRSGTMLKCDWCEHEFGDGEMIGLAQPKPGQEGPKRNWALCDKCCDLIGAKPRKRPDNSQSTVSHGAGRKPDTVSGSREDGDL